MELFAIKKVLAIIFVVAAIAFVASCTRSRVDDRDDNREGNELTYAAEPPTETPPQATPPPPQAETPPQATPAPTPALVPGEIPVIYAADFSVLPVLTGDFMQGWQFAGFNRQQIYAHFAQLAEAGIQYVILNDSSRIEGGQVSRMYFPAPEEFLSPDASRTWGVNLLEFMLSAAQQTGIRVFVGLAYDRDWWDNCLPMNTEWYAPRAELGNALALSKYEQFKARFPDAFYGWYFPHELFNNMQGLEWHFANFVNINRDFLYALNPDMPMLISPFFARDHRNPMQTRGELVRFFGYANFRAGDVFAPQDCVGVLRASIPQAVEYFRAIYEARNEANPGLRLWANNENFIMPPGQDIVPAPLYRLVHQMLATNPFVERHISFSYSHYYSTLVQGTDEHHAAYLEFLRSIR